MIVRLQWFCVWENDYLATTLVGATAFAQVFAMRPSWKRRIIATQMPSGRDKVSPLHMIMSGKSG